MAILSILKKLFIDEEFKTKIHFFRELSLFSGLPSRLISDIINITYEKSYKAQDIIFEEGALGKALYIIKEGEVSVSCKGKQVCVLGKKDYFGEMALVKESPRLATIQALTDCRFFLMYKVKFDSLVRKNPAIGERLTTMINRRFEKGEINRGEKND